MTRIAGGAGDPNYTPMAPHCNGIEFQVGPLGRSARVACVRGGREGSACAMHGPREVKVRAEVEGRLGQAGRCRAERWGLGVYREGGRGGSLYC